MERDHTPVVLTKRQEAVKFFTYLGLTLSAGAIQYALCTFLQFVVGWSYWPSYLPALVVSVIWNFTINRKFTFKSVSNVPMAMLKIGIYYCFFTPLSTWWGYLLVDSGLKIHQQLGIGLGLWKNIVLLGTMVINFITEFSTYRFIIFRKSINTSESGKREQEREALRKADAKK